MAGWVNGAEAVDPDEVCERLTGLHEQLVAGSADAEDQLADIDRSDAGALRHAGLVHAALAAAVDAVECARDAQQRVAARAAPTQPTVDQEEAVALPVSDTISIVIYPLAARNLLEVSHDHPNAVRAAGGKDRAVKIETSEKKASKGRRKKKNFHGGRRKVARFAGISEGAII